MRGRAAKEDPKAPVAGYVATRTAATKLDLPLAETPQAITVITADQIREQGARTMQEILRYAPGVNADVYGLDNRGDWFLLRGGSQGSTLLDGLRRPLSGWYGIVRDEPFAFERVRLASPT
ncbi:TonB-dependent receptor plug domain-containing protein [Geothrix sp. 21YS21S-2]|uniref:TonB-dependent receptor plug domain-containing protein n=1 Tax=Geothrix sp. 21YS21S-2 TaxID=3068893 RepID=UPI0027BAA24B|nr:TonB-dependent receptor plug domain-containing protein [Geothrix sp. 21YS21S-2]